VADETPAVSDAQRADIIDKAATFIVELTKYAVRVGELVLLAVVFRLAASLTSSWLWDALSAILLATVWLHLLSGVMMIWPDLEKRPKLTEGKRGQLILFTLFAGSAIACLFLTFELIVAMQELIGAYANLPSL